MEAAIALSGTGICASPPCTRTTAPRRSTASSTCSARPAQPDFPGSLAVPARHPLAAPGLREDRHPGGGGRGDGEHPYVSELIKKGDVIAVKEAIRTGTERGMLSFDSSLYNLVREGRIEMEEALSMADSRTNLEPRSISAEAGIRSVRDCPRTAGCRRPSRISTPAPGRPWGRRGARAAPAAARSKSSAPVTPSSTTSMGPVTG